jgi:hypothetical protein
MSEILHSHHITPKHAGGSDDPSNLVELTVEDHAIAHKVLYGLWKREEDRIAWLGLSGIIDHKTAVKMAQSLPKPESQKQKLRLHLTGNDRGKANKHREIRWITNGTEDKWIFSSDVIPEGWVPGRKNFNLSGVKAASASTKGRTWFKDEKTGKRVWR